MWMRYRTKWAWGFGDWEWRDIGIGNAKDFAEEIGCEYSDTEHFRGVDWEVHKHPPEAVYRERIKKAEQDAVSAMRYANKLRAELRARLKETT